MNNEFSFDVWEVMISQQAQQSWHLWWDWNLLSPTDSQCRTVTTNTNWSFALNAFWRTQSFLHTDVPMFYHLRSLWWNCALHNLVCELSSWFFDVRFICRQHSVLNEQTVIASSYMKEWLGRSDSSELQSIACLSCGLVFCASLTGKAGKRKCRVPLLNAITGNSAKFTRKHFLACTKTSPHRWHAVLWIAVGATLAVSTLASCKLSLAVGHTQNTFIPHLALMPCWDSGVSCISVKSWSLGRRSRFVQMVCSNGI